MPRFTSPRRVYAPQVAPSVWSRGHSEGGKIRPRCWAPRDLLASSDTQAGNQLAPESAIQCAHVEDNAWESQELAQSRVGKPELMPAASPIQDLGPFRMPQYYISEL